MFRKSIHLNVLYTMVQSNVERDRIEKSVLENSVTLRATIPPLTYSHTVNATDFRIVNSHSSPAPVHTNNLPAGRRITDND